MREIKFRAYITGLGVPFMAIQGEPDLETLQSFMFHYGDEKLMQFTGLTDKNGKEIFEGDILNCQDRIVKVVWHEQHGLWDCDFIRYIFDLCSNGITPIEFKYRAVVIGNIFENPELL